MTTTGTRRPGAELTRGLLDPALWADDPHPLLARLRREAPVAWHEERGFWAVSRHADVVAVETDTARFSSARGILVDEIGVDYPSPPTMMHTDPPAHTRYRRLVQPGFRPSAVRALEASVRAQAAELVAALPLGEPVDVVPALAVPLPIRVICGLLGMDHADWERVWEWSEAVIPGATDWPQERRDRLMAEMTEHLVSATRRRRDTPADDFLSVLAGATLDGDHLSDVELAMFLVQLLVAGNETTRNLISGGLVAFAEFPDQWAALAAGGVDRRGAVEEMLRWTTPVTSFLRTATGDTAVGGQPVAAGEPLLLLYSSADRDETVFGPDADRFDVWRHPNPHLAFGFGNHFCLGAALARLEAAAVLDELVPRVRAVEPAGTVERSPSTVIAGLRRAELRLVPA